MMKNKILSTIIISILCLSTFVILLPQADARAAPEISLTTITDKTNAQIGDTVTYIFEVTNTGPETLFNVQVDRNPAEPADKLSESGRRANDKFESGETWIFTTTHTITEATPDPLENIATATAYTRKGAQVSDSDTHKVYLYGTAGDMLPEVLTSPNQQSSGNWYGCSVAVGEGIIVVGAAYESVPYASSTDIVAQGKPTPTPTSYYGAGRVYVYSITDGTLLDTLDSPNPVNYGQFGYSVAVGEGVIVVGAPKETSGAVASAGNVYVYNIATLDADPVRLTSTNPVSNGDGQGYGVSVAVNDGIIAVGSSWETIGSVTGAGRVYLYDADDLEPLSFSPLATPVPQENGRFGWSVAVDAGVIVIGAAYEDVGTTEIAGRVYVYNAASGALIDTLTSPNMEFAGIFGFSVAVSDGVIVIGAMGETVDGYDEAGNVYVYNIAALADDPVTLSSPNPEKLGRFGNSVAISGGLIVIGAETETSGDYAYAGNVYVDSITTEGSPNTLTSLNPQERETFGWSVAVGSGVIAVGAYDAVYLFE